MATPTNTSNGVFLVKAAGDTKIINIANVNLMTYQGPHASGRDSSLTIMFHSKQSDDTNMILTLKGADADEFWGKVSAAAY